MDKHKNYLKKSDTYYEKRIKELEIKETQLAAFVGYTQFLCMKEFNVMPLKEKIRLCLFCIDRISKVETEQYQGWTNEYKEILKQLQDGTL